MFFWRRVAPQIPEDGLKPTATPGYTRNFRDLNDQVSRGKSFSGYERNPLFLNRSGNGFTEVGGLLGVGFDDDARAVATVDWDRDGDLDLWVSNRTAPQVRLLRNHHPTHGASVAVRLIGNGLTSNREAIGARLTLSTPSTLDSPQIRTVHGGDGFLAQSSAWSHFGLGDEEDQDLTLGVRWPDGGSETFAGLRAGRRYLVKQGEGLSSVPVGRLESISREKDGKPEAGDGDEADGRSGFWIANRVPFPELTYTSPAGTRVSTAAFSGKPVLINLWATWCLPCRQELKELADHAEELAEHGATVLALNVDGLSVDGAAPVNAPPERALARAGYELPWGKARTENLAKIEILIEYLSSLRASLSVPTSVLVDANGHAAAVYLEPVQWEQLERDLETLKASPDVALRSASPRPGQWLADPRQIDRASYLGNYATRFGINGFPEESQRLYQMLQQDRGVTSAREYYNQAKSAAQQGLTEQAIGLYQEALRLEPDYGRALTGLGAIYLKQKRMNEARVLFERAIGVDPNHAVALINLAMIEQAQGNLGRAVERLTKVVTLNPEYHEAHLSLGSVLASMKRYEGAIEHLVKAVELNPRSIVGQLNLAKAYQGAGQLKPSEECYRAVAVLDPKMAYPHFGLGNIQASERDHQSAVGSYRRAIELGAKNAVTYTRLGGSLLAVGDRNAGKEALENALAMDPNYGPALEAIEALRSSGD